MADYCLYNICVIEFYEEDNGTMLKDNTLTYISLFSSAGVGCYGFKKAGYECIATNEIIERRLEIQKINKKCKYDGGYICGDIKELETKNKIINEINRWNSLGNDKVDVVIATPPCQGMSVANHKKTENEIDRNSLVVESIKMIQDIKPRFFIFENVQAFMKTGCTAPDGTVKAIGQVISEELGTNYVISSRILNFKNYGSNSSRTRTLVIGVEKALEDFVSPIELYPNYREERTLRNVIGDMPQLEWGEICPTDFYHAFRTYPKEMREWIHDLKEGDCAFDNENPMKRPHHIVNGEVVPNIRKNADKYTRQRWDSVAPCVHTRNDQLASQNTIHPSEDRVFSIRELMRMMSIPDDFKWIDMSLEDLNKLSIEDKKKLLKKEEINIRQSIGEAVPTQIFYQIAMNIKTFMNQTHYGSVDITKVIDKYSLRGSDSVVDFVKKNPLNLGFATLSRIAELTNTKRENNAAFYTNKFIINEIYKELPDIDKDEISVLEPSVGVGNFLPFIFRKYESKKKIDVTVIDIDEKNLEVLKALLDKKGIPSNVVLKYICADTLLYDFGDKRYDLVIGNPPFSKLKGREAKKYLTRNYNKATTNTFEFFLEMALRISRYVVMITPKALLNTPEFDMTRSMLEKLKVYAIDDFGEHGFKGVLVETICVFIDTQSKPGDTLVESITLNKKMCQRQSYIMDNKYPYWLIYRDKYFDDIAKKMDFDVFDVFRDRQITNSNTSHEKRENSIRVLKSRNISDDGTEIVDIPGYDSYIDEKSFKKMSVSKFWDNTDVYLTPNMTYKPRVVENIVDTTVNGSLAILIPKKKRRLSKRQMRYFASDEYRRFYKIARNFQTRSLNVDATSVYFYGVLREEQ